MTMEADSSVSEPQPCCPNWAIAMIRQIPGGKRRSGSLK
jgi:hypothetical protein